MSSIIGSVKGLVALVTGGASGLGLATAKRLLLQEASVVICDLPSSCGKEIAEELGSQCVFVAADVTKEKDVQNVLSTVESEFHKLDILVNCAGIWIANHMYDFNNDQPHPMEILEKMLSVNTAGTFNVIRLAVGLMAKNQADDADGQKGVIINTASVAAFEGRDEVVAYSASKGAIVRMTLPLARDLASQGIRCVSIAPGPFDTPILNSAESTIQKIKKMMLFPPRLGKPDEFAHLVQAIVENRMLNGCTIRLDGGYRSQI